MGELGNKLKEARESKGLSLREVEEATKIRKKYLQALENEDFEQIPGKTYAKGFLRNYSNYLRLDTEDLTAEFEILVSDSFKDKDIAPVPTASTSTSTSSDRESKLFKFGLVIAAVLLLFIAGSLFNNDAPEANAPQANNGVANESGPQNGANQENKNEEPSANAGENETSKETEPPEAITGVNLGIEIIKDQCWISVTSDGNQVFSGTLNQGDKRVFEGDSEIVITLGNAGAAKVTYNGKELPPLGEDGEVVTPPPFVAADGASNQNTAQP